MAKSVAQIVSEHRAEIESVRNELATNFDTPAQRVINAGMLRMRLPRFNRAGDDLWEQITCFLNGWEYEKPPECSYLLCMHGGRYEKQ